MLTGNWPAWHDLSCWLGHKTSHKQTNKSHCNQSNSLVWTKLICLVEDCSPDISEQLLPKYLQRDSNYYLNSNFHFSHYKPVETVSCHSNESTWATAIKNITFVEANVMNIYAMCQLHLPHGFWGDDFWRKKTCMFSHFDCHGNQSNSVVWTKFIYLVKDYSRNISVKLLSKYMQWDRNKGLFSLIYRSMKTLGCHSVESTWAMAIKKFS